MTEEAMSPLRRRMIEDMTIRRLAPKTQEGYIRTIKNFAVFLGRSPDMASSKCPPLSIDVGQLPLFGRYRGQSRQWHRHYRKTGVDPLECGN